MEKRVFGLRRQGVVPSRCSIAFQPALILAGPSHQVRSRRTTRRPIDFRPSVSTIPRWQLRRCGAGETRSRLRRPLARLTLSGCIAPRPTGQSTTTFRSCMSGTSNAGSTKWVSLLHHEGWAYTARAKLREDPRCAGRAQRWRDCDLSAWVEGGPVRCVPVSISRRVVHSDQRRLFVTDSVSRPSGSVYEGVPCLQLQRGVGSESGWPDGGAHNDDTGIRQSASAVRHKAARCPTSYRSRWGSENSTEPVGCERRRM